MSRMFAGIAAGCLLAAPAWADFSYQQTTKITGGAMMAMMRVAGVFSKQAREPIQQTVMVKGDRMATLTADSAHVIDLGKETITDINFKNKTYSVITFEQMKQALAALQEKMKGQKAPDQADVNFKASVKETGQSKVISGLNAKEVILMLEMQMKDRESGQQGSMDVVSDMWLAPQTSGYDEVKDFYRRMAEKMAWAPGMALGGLAQSQPGMMKGMAELAKEASKLEGIPVLQVTRMGSGAQAMADFSAKPQEAPQGPSARETAGESAAGAIAGRLGRLGGLRRGKKQEEAPAEPPPQAQPQAAPAAGMLMETTTELSGFSSAAVDGSRLEVPAGFKQVENEMVKQSRR